jgi:tungstate transport system permease protein
MDLLLQGLEQAARLIAAGDRNVIEIARLSLEVSALATLLALVVGVPFGVWIGLKPFPGRNLLVSLVNTGMGLPPVVVGLFVTIFLWRSGPFGFLELLYTPAAIIVAQLILALPVVVGLTIAAIQQIDPRLSLQLLGLGASRAQLLVLLLREARLPLLAAVMAGFGAVISEVGASLMVGGNILHHTRVLTTATVLETSKGNFDVAIALSLILLGISFVINLALTLIQQRATRG